MFRFAKGNSSKNKVIFFLISPGNLLTIFYKLTKFEAPSCYSLWHILITKFHDDPLKVQSVWNTLLNPDIYVKNLYRLQNAADLGCFFYRCEDCACMLHIILLCAQISQNVKYWYEICDILVPILNIVKFAKCEICIQHS